MTADPAPAQPPAIDPEALALRGRPPRAVRLRRGVLIAIATVTAIALALTGWLALRDRIVHPVLQGDSGTEPARPPTDTLGSLPKNYGDVPKLGPPLPGDLGRPLLEQQQRALPQTLDPDRPPRGPDPEAAQRLDELHAAAQSPLLTRAAGRKSSTDAAEPAPGPAVASGDGTSVSRVERTADASVDPHRIEPVPSPYTLAAGSVIPASLITGLRSDLPGMVSAQVSEQVWDSATGQILLIPQGSRLIGRYDDTTAFGQKRLRIEWQRLLFPDGSGLSLDPVPGTDAAGMSGLEDRVDSHGWLLVKSAALSTVLGIGGELQLSGRGGIAQAIRQSGQQSFSQAGDKFTSHALDIRPTIEIRPGAPVRLVVQKDLVLRPWQEGAGQ